MMSKILLFPLLQESQSPSFQLEKRQDYSSQHHGIVLAPVYRKSSHLPEHFDLTENALQLKNTQAAQTDKCWCVHLSRTSSFISTAEKYLFFVGLYYY